MEKASIEVVNNLQEQRWEASEGGELLGFSAYREQPGQVTFTHTEVNPALSGRGIGSRLAEAAVEDAVERGLRIVPRCPFIRAYLERHPEFAASVDLPADTRQQAKPSD